MLNEFASWLYNTFENVMEGMNPEFDESHDNGLIDLQCGKRVFNDVPAKMRTELWLSSLQREKGKGAAAVAQYPKLCSAPISPDVLAEIEKDTHRTFPGHSWLSTRAGQLSMLRVLRAYAALDPDVGYSQGMNFLAGLFLTYLDEAPAFGALALVMQDRGLRELYKPGDGMEHLQMRLWQLGNLIPTKLAAHLELHAVLPVLYASSWLLTCFAAEFPISFAARVMDIVISDSYAAPLMKVAVQIVERCEQQLLSMDDMEDMVKLLRQTVPSWPKSTLQDLLTEALGQPWSNRQAAVLKKISGAETVADAVLRVEKTGGAGGDGNNIVGINTQIDAYPTTPPPLPSTSTTTTTTTTTAGAAALGRNTTSDAANFLFALPPPPSSKTEKVDWNKCRPETPTSTTGIITTPINDNNISNGNNANGTNDGINTTPTTNDNNDIIITPSTNAHAPGTVLQHPLDCTTPVPRTTPLRGPSSTPAIDIHTAINNNNNNDNNNNNKGNRVSTIESMASSLQSPFESLYSTSINKNDSSHVVQSRERSSGVDQDQYSSAGLDVEDESSGGFSDFVDATTTTATAHTTTTITTKNNTSNNTNSMHVVQPQSRMFSPVVANMTGQMSSSLSQQHSTLQLLQKLDVDDECRRTPNTTGVTRVGGTTSPATNTGSSSSNNDNNNNNSLYSGHCQRELSEYGSFKQASNENGAHAGLPGEGVVLGSRFSSSSVMSDSSRLQSMTSQVMLMQQAHANEFSKKSRVEEK